MKRWLRTEEPMPQAWQNARAVLIPKGKSDEVATLRTIVLATLAQGGHHENAPRCARTRRSRPSGFARKASRSTDPRMRSWSTSHREEC